MKQLVLDLCDEAEACFHSFQRLWVLYHELSCLICLYVKLGPRERWLSKLTGFLASVQPSQLAQAADPPFCGVYVWVSVLTSHMYVGSTINF